MRVLASRGPKSLSLAALLAGCIVAFSAAVVVNGASGAHYHVECVGNGFVHGTSTTDGSFHSRVEASCGSGLKVCALYTSGTYRGYASTYDPNTCNFWVGSGTECASEAHVDFNGVFVSHVHYAHNWCG
jgi:hypothetical protein